MKVEIAYAADAQTQFLKEIDVPEASSIEQVILLSDVLTEFPEIDLSRNTVGVWSQKRPLDTLIKANERIEIYRPLLLSPTEARRLRAERAKR